MWPRLASMTTWGVLLVRRRLATAARFQQRTLRPAYRRRRPSRSGQTPSVTAMLTRIVHSARRRVAPDLGAGGTSATATTAGAGLGSMSLACKVAPGIVPDRCIVRAAAAATCQRDDSRARRLVGHPAQSFFVDDSSTVALGGIPESLPVGCESATTGSARNLSDLRWSLQSGICLRHFSWCAPTSTVDAALPATGLPIGTCSSVTATFAGSELYFGAAARDRQPAGHHTLPAGTEDEGPLALQRQRLAGQLERADTADQLHGWVGRVRDSG